mmetsp:Transcript_20027/g.14736  ORF Transcript_20027/g.14736 Transcript_20027/m.14736 type:complete len:81 (+) Transcript_20027:223-465(+)
MSRYFGWPSPPLDTSNANLKPAAIVFKQPQDYFFIWNNLQHPLPAPANLSYYSVPPPNWPPFYRFKMVFLNKQLALNTIA